MKCFKDIETFFNWYFFLAKYFNTHIFYMLVSCVFLNCIFIFYFNSYDPAVDNVLTAISYPNDDNLCLDLNSKNQPPEFHVDSKKQEEKLSTDSKNSFDTNQFCMGLILFECSFIIFSIFTKIINN